MPFVDVSIASVPDDKKDDYIRHCREVDVLFKDAGALSVVENWGAEIPDGKLTDFNRAVQAGKGETVVLGWVVWPDKATRDAGWETLMKDERMAILSPPFDGKRMIYGGFETINQL